MFNESGIHNAVRLKSNQEQADSKVILDGLDALDDLEVTLVILSSLADTDTMVLAVSVTIEWRVSIFELRKWKEPQSH